MRSWGALAGVLAARPQEKVARLYAADCYAWLEQQVARWGRGISGLSTLTIDRGGGGVGRAEKSRLLNTASAIVEFC